jgi:hypothetical protein
VSRSLRLLTYLPSLSRSILTSSARSVRSSSQSIKSSANVRVFGFPPELSDPVGAVEVGQHQDVEQLGTGSGAEGVEPLTELSFELLQVHGIGR